jgi:SAM-dependent methyltransferase
MLRNILYRAIFQRQNFFSSKSTCGVSEDMLLTLSIGHTSNLTFSHNSDLTAYLKMNNFVGSPHIEQIFSKYERRLFMGLSPADPSTKLTPEAFNLKPGVDLTSSMMQSIFLSLSEIVLKTDQGIKNVVDLGCANGFLTFGLSEIVKQNFSAAENYPKVYGFDSDPDAISSALALKEFFKDDLVKFMPMKFEEFAASSKIGIKNGHFLCFGFALTRMDLLSKVYVNPELTDVWTLAPIFNDRGEQDLSIVCPTKSDAHLKFEKFIRESGLPVKLESQPLDEDHVVYRLMTCYFSPKNPTGADAQEEFPDVAPGPDGIKAKTNTKYEVELEYVKTVIIGFESLIKEKFSKPDAGEKKTRTMQDFIHIPEIKEIMLQLAAAKKKQAV